MVEKFPGVYPVEPQMDRQFVTALARGVQILRCFDAASPELGTRELAALTGLPQPTVWRLCHTLCEIDCLGRSASGDKFRVSAGILGLGQSALTSRDVMPNIERELQDFADATKTAISLSVREDTEMRIVLRVHHAGTLLFDLSAGSRLPIASTASGWAALAMLSAKERDRMATKLAGHYEKREWPRTWKAAGKAMEAFACDGFIVNHGEFHPDMCGVAIPFVVNSQIYTLSLGAPKDELQDDRIRLQIAEPFRRLAHTVRTALKAEVRR